MKENILLNKNVLVAEDNAINQMVVKHTLLKLGATADIAGDGAEAIEKFKKNQYDLVLMDIQMPLMDGYETTAYIRNQLGSNVPIVAMTAFALNGEEEKCFESGMNDYVSKPFTIENLSAVIEKVLSFPLKNTTNPYILTEKGIAVDISMLYDISGDDESYISIMIHTFLENMPVTIAKMEESLRNHEWDSLSKLAHFAKSSLSVIKVNEMFEAVITVEETAKKRVHLSQLSGLVEKIKEAFIKADEILAKKFPKIGIAY